MGNGLMLIMGIQEINELYGEDGFFLNCMLLIVTSTTSTLLLSTGGPGGWLKILLNENSRIENMNRKS